MDGARGKCGIVSISRSALSFFVWSSTHDRTFAFILKVLANQRYNEKADIFSYGIILWELLTRTCPYEGMNAVRSFNRLVI